MGSVSGLKPRPITGWKPVPRAGNRGTAILAVKLTDGGSNSSFAAGGRHVPLRPPCLCGVPLFSELNEGRAPASLIRRS